MNYCLNSSVEFLFWPGRVLETFAFDAKKGVKNCLLRHCLRRIAALVAPIFYLYEACLRLVGIGDRLSFFSTLQNACSALCEIPQKLLCASNVNYFGTRERNYQKILISH